jgi:hypothetical protein
MLEYGGLFFELSVSHGALSHDDWHIRLLCCLQLPTLPLDGSPAKRPHHSTAQNQIWPQHTTTPQFREINIAFGLFEVFFINIEQLKGRVADVSS